jgi:CheY-like chemotaxis protein
MIKNDGQTILVVDDIEETLDGIKELLTSDGYRVYAARDERDAAEKARLNSPDLMLVSLDGEVADIVVAAKRIRSLAGLKDELPIIIFCVGELKEGYEVSVEPNIYLAHPDNFNQLRDFISRLLDARKIVPSQSGGNALLNNPH